MISLYGKIISGIGSASGAQKRWNGMGSICLQVNYLQKIAPELVKKLEICTMATINVNLTNKIFFKYWEYIFENIFWLPDCKNWSEKIAFTPIIFKYNMQYENAWLYKAFSSPHNKNNHLIEVISPPINFLEINKTCIIKIDRKYIDDIM